MKNEEIVRIGRLLGLSFNEKDNYPSALKNNRVVFNGCNAQRVVIEGKWDDDDILIAFGYALKEFGRIDKAMEISMALRY